MKTIAMKVEAETKATGALIDLLDAQVTRTAVLEDEIRSSGADETIIAQGLEALEILAKEVRQAKRAYLVFHGIVKTGGLDPNVPRPRTGT